jgi:lipopolysaccharide/colanic/teichoic acid biosynthesis glycosyltransferase
MRRKTLTDQIITVGVLIALASLALIVSEGLRLVTLDPSFWRFSERKRVARIVIKRSFDIVVSAIGLLLLSPLLLLIAIANWLTAPGPIFYLAPRIGQHGRPFRVYKFRTMIVNADRMGPKVTVAGDSRVTPVGRILRKTKLDELPQLINVLRGDMSLVGPRPEDPRYVAMYTPTQRGVLNVAPGITSPASVHYRDEQALLVGVDWETLYINEIMPAKLAIDLDYAQHPSLTKDISIISQTIFALYVK